MLSCANKSLVYAPISRLRRSFAGIRKMPTSRAIKKETCKQACSLFFYRLDWHFIHCFRVYYSITVATRPDPTVHPPSRYLNTVFLHIFYAFRWQNLQKTAVFAYCIFICLSSWHRFGTVGTSSSFTNTNLNYRSASLNFHRPLWIFAPAPSIAPAIMIAATIIAIAIIILPIRC